MLFAVAGSGRGRDSAASIGDIWSLMTTCLEQVAKARLHKRPRSLVLWLFLGPLHLGVRVAIKHRLE